MRGEDIEMKDSKIVGAQISTKQKQLEYLKQMRQ
jgi:hypothetical protein